MPRLGLHVEVSARRRSNTVGLTFDEIRLDMDGEMRAVEHPILDIDHCLRYASFLPRVHHLAAHALSAIHLQLEGSDMLIPVGWPITVLSLAFPSLWRSETDTPRPLRALHAKRQ